MSVRERPSRGLRTTLWVFGLLFLCGGLCISPMACNNYIFGQFKREVASIPLPPQTKLVFKSEEFGLLWGGGNSCAHQVRLVIATELSPSEVKAHYAKYTVKHPDEESDEPVTARIIPFSGEPDFQASGDELFYPLFPSSRYSWYIVEFRGVTEPGLDLRCS